MYLSRLLLNPRSRQVQRDLANCYAMHRTVMSGWGDLDTALPRAGQAILFRVDDLAAGPSVLVQSATAPDWSRLADGYLRRAADCKALDGYLDGVRQGQVFRFRLFANPTRALRAEGVRGKRVDIRPDALRLAWLRRRADAAGFALSEARSREPAVRLGPVRQLQGWRGHDRHAVVTIAGTLFEGLLRVAELDLFRRALVSGIGRGRAFGCGLLSVARAGPGDAA